MATWHKGGLYLQFFQVSEWSVQEERYQEAGFRSPVPRTQSLLEEMCSMPGCISSSRTNEPSCDFQDLESPMRQRMSSFHSERSSGKGDLDREEQEGALNTEEQDHQLLLATLICKAHGHFYWSLCRFTDITPPAGLAPAPASPGTAPQTVPWQTVPLYRIPPHHQILVCSLG